MRWLLRMLLVVVGTVVHAEGPGAHRGAVATSHAMATEAAMATFARGGNAVDAAIAAGLTLGVVEGYNSGIGGGCFLLIRCPTGELIAMDGRETAPARADGRMFEREGRVDPELSVTGPLAVGVPGSLAVYAQAAQKYGRRPLREALEAAAQVAVGGFVLDGRYVGRLREVHAELGRFPASRRVFTRADGAALEEGDRLCQPDLAATYRSIGRHGPDWFYRGPFAAATARWMRRNGGRVTAGDFARYRVHQRDPIRTRYRGYEIVGFPPPSSGGVHVAQILNLLGHFELGSLGPDSADWVHLTAEAMKRAFADRAYWLGDPAYTRVPAGLTGLRYAAEMVRGMDRDRATVVTGPGDPEGAMSPEAGDRRHTTHWSAADAAGWWVACTATLNTTFGAKVVVPGTGVMLNNQMDDFAAQTGVPNYFGLVGGAANAVAAGKRPLSSMSPTIVLRDGEPLLSVGASGGPTIITQTLLTLIRVLDFGEDLPTAMAAPRFHHQWRPDELRVEAGFDVRMRRDLEARGHRVVEGRPLGSTQAVGWDAERRVFIAVADPRGGGKGVVR